VADENEGKKFGLTSIPVVMLADRLVETSFYLNFYGKRPLRKPRCTWMYNIKMELEKIGCGVTE
jgi:hypothetical protein